MADFYITDSDGLLVSFGYAADGDEQMQAQDGNTCTLGDVPGMLESRAPYAGARWHIPTESWMDTRTLDAAKYQAWIRIKRARDAVEASGFTWDGSVFQTDLQRIPGAALLALMTQMSGSPYEQEWTLLDNTKRMLDAADMIAVGVAQGQHVSDTFVIGDGLRTDIAEATTNEQLDLIVWPT